MIPVGLAYLVFRWLRLRGYKIIGIVIMVAVTIWSVYSSYTAFYPTDGFYEDEFEIYTGLDFPASGNILTKDASYPDLHGDYSATAIFKTDKNDFNKILTAIRNDKKFQLDTILLKFGLTNSDTINYETNFTKCYTLSIQDNNLIFTISFNERDNLIEIRRGSW